MTHVLDARIGDRLWRCSCQELFPSRPDLEAHAEVAEALHDELVASIAGVIETALERVTEKNDTSAPGEWVPVDEMCFDIAEELNRRYFVMQRP